MFKWADKLPDTGAPPPPPPPDPRAAMMKWFSYAHLPSDAQETSAQFAIIASWMFGAIPAGPEATVAMRKLLEAKDAAVRASMDGAAKKGPAGKASTGPATTTREEPDAKEG